MHTPPPVTLDNLQGEDPLMIYNVHRVRRVMNKPINILLYGETGTGKNTFAQAIHAASDRADKAFVAINCSSMPANQIGADLFGPRYGFTAYRESIRDKILQANGGTLFLDEIADMPLALQTQLVRVLKDKEVLPLGIGLPVGVNLHIISATHRNLQAPVVMGSFREALYYQLNPLTLILPALRERTDRDWLVHSILADESQEQGVQLDKEALTVLNEYAWPGNLRELRNVLRTAAALCENSLIRLEDLPPEIAQVSPQEMAHRFVQIRPFQPGSIPNAL